MAKVKTAKPTQSARLTLTIAGSDYDAVPLASHELPSRTTRGWRLSRDDPKAGSVVYLVTVGNLSGRKCSCEAFKFAGGEPCKHLAAARSVGLL